MGILLSEKQKEAVNYNEGALLVSAGPGSGKTRVLTERIRRLLAEDKSFFRILALTFTNKAANEMQERLTEVPNIRQRAFIGTLHSFCLEVLTNRGKPVGIEGTPHIMESNQERRQMLLQSVMGDVVLQQILRSKDSKGQKKLLSEWFEQIEQAKKKLMSPEAIDDPIVREVYELYDLSLRASNTLDFDDLLLLTYQLFTDRPKIADFYRRQYKYICIDEAQDLNEAQYQVIRSLCSDSYQNIMMVGDCNQAIFGWNGADPKFMQLLKMDFNAKHIELTENFRSSQAIVNLAQKLKPVYQVVGVLPIKGEVCLLQAKTEQEEAELIVNHLKFLIDSGHQDIEDAITLDRCAILGRNRYVLVKIEQELSRHDIKFYKKLSGQEESESDLIKDFELCMRLLINPQDRFHFNILINRWEIDTSSIADRFDNENNQLIKWLNSNTPTNRKPVLEAIDELNYPNCNFSKSLDILLKFANNIEHEEERLLITEDIKLWSERWDNYLRAKVGGQASLSKFLSQVAIGVNQKTTHEGIALLTVHSAKGLEFDIVFIAGLVEGIFPDYRAKNPTLLNEEDNNMFVAVTRARRVLILSYPQSRTMPWGDSRLQNPSRYLKQFELIQC
ncbi:ATP-dependent helicase [Pseudanabaena minima]|uniref:ATP-dependent helicase n=1 Tax=Pseudanabaena minima TaxID=890415 RepID=UPI003DA85A70